MLNSNYPKFFRPITLKLNHHTVYYNSYFKFKKKTLHFHAIKNILYPFCLSSHKDKNFALKFINAHQDYLTAVINQVKLFPHLNFTIVAVGTPFRYNDRDYKIPENNKILDYEKDSLVTEYSQKELTWLQEANSFINNQCEKLSLDKTKINLKPWHEHYKDPDFPVCSNLLWDIYHQENLVNYNLSPRFTENFKTIVDRIITKFSHHLVKKTMSDNELFTLEKRGFLHDLEELVVYLLWLGGSQALLKNKIFQQYDLLINPHLPNNAMELLQKETCSTIKLLPSCDFHLQNSAPKLQEQAPLDIYQIQKCFQLFGQFMSKNKLISEDQFDEFNKLIYTTLKNSS